MRFRRLVLWLIFFVLITLSVMVCIRVYKVGYFITGNSITKDIRPDSGELISQFRKYLIDDKNKIIWWRLKFSNKILNNNLKYWIVTPDGNIIAGCGRDEFFFGGSIRKITFLINSDLISNQKQIDLNQVFIICSMISYDDKYIDSVIDIYKNMFNENQFILEKR